MPSDAPTILIRDTATILREPAIRVLNYDLDHLSITFIHTFSIHFSCLRWATDTEGMHMAILTMAHQRICLQATADETETEMRTQMSSTLAQEKATVRVVTLARGPTVPRTDSPPIHGLPNDEIEKETETREEKR